MPALRIEQNFSKKSPSSKTQKRENANEMNGDSEEYLAYRCGLLDSIAQDTKFKLDTTLLAPDAGEYSNGGVCAEADFFTDLNLYKSGR